MKLKGRRHVFMDQTPGAAGAGAAAAPPAGGGAADPGAGEGSGAAAAPAAGGAKPEGGAESAAGSSALSAGRAGAEPGAGDGDAGAGEKSVWERVPEKFQVKKSDGTLDQDATAAKVEEHRASLEKRLGEGGVRPKTADEYKMPELPEALKDMPLDEASTSAWKKEAHEMGLSQSQFEKVLGKYFDLAPQLVDAGHQLTAEETVASLKKTWGDDYAAKGGDAWRGMTQIAQAAGLTVQEVDAELGNSPAFNRIMAAIGAQLKEDSAVNVTGGSGAGGADAEKLQMSEAFRDPKHPDHKAVSERWLKLVAGNVKDEVVLI